MKIEDKCVGCDRKAVHPNDNFSDADEKVVLCEKCARRIMLELFEWWWHVKLVG
jgi:DNA-directed RNA polymerase subunit RPC12/RpoP